jgi:AbrB family looped-hinge helix DNA binding protein
MVVASLIGMRDALIPIDNAGRVVLPKELRNELAINPGDLLNVSIQGDQITLRPNRDKSGFIKRGDALVFSTGATDLLDNEVVEDIRRSERASVSVNIAEGFERQKRK